MSKSTQRKQSALSAGKQAGRHYARKMASRGGLTFAAVAKNENPYLKMSGLRGVWNAGWKIGKQQVKEKA